VGPACNGEGALRGLLASMREEVSWAWRGSLGRCGKGKDWERAGPKRGDEVGRPGWASCWVSFSF
jgi:hypothetical protein